MDEEEEEEEEEEDGDVTRVVSPAGYPPTVQHAAAKTTSCLSNIRKSN